MAGKRSVFPCQFPECNFTCMSNSARIKHHTLHTNKVARAGYEGGRVVGHRQEEVGLEHGMDMEYNQVGQQHDGAQEDQEHVFGAEQFVENNESEESEVEESGNVFEQGNNFSDSSGGSFMHSSDWSSSEEDGEEEKKEGTSRKMLHVIPDYDDCTDKYLDYKGPDARLAQLPQEIKEAGVVHI